ncbi:LemA family protein [bacterium]|nr:MAG: LemA family protein [bacterium]
MLKKLLPVSLVVVVILWGIGVNNGLVEKEESVNSAWSKVETQYQRRADLIPNLVNTVKGAANFEQETLTAVTDARSKATSMQLSPEMLNDPQALENFQKVQSQLSGALSRLLVSVEKYPDLKANANFRDLQAQLEGTENRIAVERSRYNDVAKEFNTSVRKFPTSLIASLTGFKAKAYFSAEEGAEKAPNVSFN